MSAFGGKADMMFCGCLLSRSLLEVKRTSLVAAHMSAYDPKRTSRPVPPPSGQLTWPSEISRFMCLIRRTLMGDTTAQTVYFYDRHPISRDIPDIHRCTV